MIKVNGIAGVFLYANDPKTLAEWYTLHFGLDFLSDIADTYYMEFYFRDDTDTSRRWSTVFAIMPAKHPLSPERGEYMINYRVDDLKRFLEQLQASDIPIGPVEEQNDGRYPGSKGCLAGSPILKAITWSYTSHSRCLTLTHSRTLLYNYN